jgi:hypothetical protein
VKHLGSKAIAPLLLLITLCGQACAQSTVSLADYFKLDAASGNETGAFASTVLTETSGTIASTTGKLGNARDFEAGDTEYFEVADNATVSVADVDFSIGGWVQLESDPAASVVIVAKGNAFASAAGEYVLYYTGGATDRFRFSLSNGTTIATVNANNFGAAATGTWYYVVAWNDSAADTINIQVNNGTADSAAHTGGCHDSTGAFRIGDETAGTRPWDGLIDEVEFTKRVIPASERTRRYNAGNGLAFPWSQAAFARLYRGRR